MCVSQHVSIVFDFEFGRLGNGDWETETRCVSTLMPEEMWLILTGIEPIAQVKSIIICTEGERSIHSKGKRPASFHCFATPGSEGWWRSFNRSSGHG